MEAKGNIQTIELRKEGNIAVKIVVIDDAVFDIQRVITICQE